MASHPLGAAGMDEPGLAFTFVTHGIDSALVQTKAAGDKDVGIGGGANVIWQYLGARSSMSSGYIFLRYCWYGRATFRPSWQPDDRTGAQHPRHRVALCDSPVLQRRQLTL